MLINHAHHLVRELSELSAASDLALESGDARGAALFAQALTARSEELGRVRDELHRRMEAR